MSLRAFHILFITISTLLSFGFGVWCFRFYSGESSGVYQGIGLTSFLIGIGLIFYGTKFLCLTKRFNSHE